MDVPFRPCRRARASVDVPSVSACRADLDRTFPAQRLVRVPCAGCHPPAHFFPLLASSHSEQWKKIGRAASFCAALHFLAGLCAGHVSSAAVLGVLGSLLA